MKTIVNYINLASALFLVFTAIFHNFRVHEISYYVFFTSYILEIVLEKRWNNFQWNKKNLYYTGMLLFFLLPLLYRPFDTDTYFKLLFEKRYPLLGIGIIGLLGVNGKYKLNYFLNTIIISSVLSILYLIVFKVGVSEFITNPTRDYLFTIQRIEHINSHMMFNFYLNLALISIWYMISRSWRQTRTMNRYLYIGAMTLIFFILYLSEGRSGFLASIMLMCAFIFFEIWKRKKTLGLMLALMIPFVFVALASGHKRLSEEQVKNEPRLFLWEAAVEVIENSSPLGNGMSRAQEKYDICRNEHETPEFKYLWHDVHRVRFIDCHNQYLQITMEFGILGIGLLLFLLIYPGFIVDNQRKLLALFILCLSAYQSIFDMFITGQFCFLFCFLTLLLLVVPNNIDHTAKQQHGQPAITDDSTPLKHSDI